MTGCLRSGVVFSAETGPCCISYFQLARAEQYLSEVDVEMLLKTAPSGRAKADRSDAVHVDVIP